MVWPNVSERYEQINDHILHGPDDRAVAFRQAVTDECNMTAVAVRVSRFDNWMFDLIQFH